MKADKKINRLDGCMRALAFLRVCYDPIFDKNIPYGIIAKITADEMPTHQQMTWLYEFMGKLDKTINSFDLTSGMLVDARALMDSIQQLVEGTDKSPEEVFAWWINRSNRSPSMLADPPL